MILSVQAWEGMQGTAYKILGTLVFDGGIPACISL